MGRQELKLNRLHNDEITLKELGIDSKIDSSGNKDQSAKIKLEKMQEQ